MTVTCNQNSSERLSSIPWGFSQIQGSHFVDKQPPDLSLLGSLGHFYICQSHINPLWTDVHSSQENYHWTQPFKNHRIHVTVSVWLALTVWPPAHRKDWPQTPSAYWQAPNTCIFMKKRTSKVHSNSSLPRVFRKGVFWFLVNHDHTPNMTSFAIAIASTCPHMNACMEVWKEKIFEGNWGKKWLMTLTWDTESADGYPLHRSF